MTDQSTASRLPRLGCTPAQVALHLQRIAAIATRKSKPHETRRPALILSAEETTAILERLSTGMWFWRSRSDACIPPCCADHAVAHVLGLDLGLYKHRGHACSVLASLLAQGHIGRHWRQRVDGRRPLKVLRLPAAPERIRMKRTAPAPDGPLYRHIRHLPRQCRPGTPETGAGGGLHGEVVPQVPPGTPPPHRRSERRFWRSARRRCSVGVARAPSQGRGLIGT